MGADGAREPGAGGVRAFATAAERCLIGAAVREDQRGAELAREWLVELGLEAFGLDRHRIVARLLAGPCRVSAMRRAMRRAGVAPRELRELDACREAALEPRLFTAGEAFVEIRRARARRELLVAAIDLAHIAEHGTWRTIDALISIVSTARAVVHETERDVVGLHVAVDEVRDAA